MTLRYYDSFNSYASTIINIYISIYIDNLCLCSQTMGTTVVRSVGISFGHDLFPIRTPRHNGRRPFVIAQSLLGRTQNRFSSDHHRTGRINGPSSTLPPPLVVLARKPDQSLASYLLAS